jgi:hypothetical protein
MADSGGISVVARKTKSKPKRYGAEKQFTTTLPQNDQRVLSDGLDLDYGDSSDDEEPLMRIKANQYKPERHLFIHPVGSLLFQLLVLLALQLCAFL